MSLHLAVAGMFLAFGLGIGLWSGASGAILARAGVDPGTFGILLTLYTGVYLLAMSSGGRCRAASASARRSESPRS